MTNRLTNLLAAAVLTWHGDVMRSGWYNQEYFLNPTSVPGINQLWSTSLDNSEVQAQPLIYGDSAYVATQGDNLYRIDTSTGFVLAQRSFGDPVVGGDPGCPSYWQPPIVSGITSTPVIDPDRGWLYLIDVTETDAGPAFSLHAVSTGTLADVLPPQPIAPTAMLADGQTYSFQPTLTRQRSALLLDRKRDILYAGFFGFCPYHDAHGMSEPPRGWALSWDASTLRPVGQTLPNRSGALTDGGARLTDFWMSGSGLALDADGGDVVGVTGNTASGTFNLTDNLSESVLRMESGLSGLRDRFTPIGHEVLDARDRDFGSGGVSLFPGDYAVAVGKAGWMYVLDSHLHEVVQARVGPCWCAESWYEDGGPGPIIVASGGDTLGLWQFAPGEGASLAQVAAAKVPTAADAGFFTAVSSDGPSDVVVWVLTRDGTTPKLIAYDPEGQTLTKLGQWPAGSWPAYHNQNAVPVVADGHVYVATWGALTAWGLSK